VLPLGALGIEPEKLDTHPLFKFFGKPL